MSIRHFLALWPDETNKIYYEDLSAPYPEPRIRYPHVGSVDSCVPTWNGSTYQAGDEIVQTFGTRDSRGRVDIRIPQMDDDLLDATEALLNLKSPLVWSPDDGVAKKVKVILLPDPDAFRFDPHPGFPGIYVPVEMKFKVMEILLWPGS